MIERPRLLDFFPDIESWGEMYDFVCCDYLRKQAPKIPTKLMRLLAVVFSVGVAFCSCALFNYLFDFKILHLILIILFNAVYFITFVFVLVCLFERYIGTFLDKKYKDYWFYKISEKNKFSLENQEKCLMYEEALIKYYKQNENNIRIDEISKIDKIIAFGENPYENKEKYISSPLYLYSEIDRLDYCNRIYETHKREFSNQLGVFYKSGDKQKFVPWELMPLVYEFGINLRYVYNDEVKSDSFYFYKELHGSPFVTKILAPHEELEEIKRYKQVFVPLRDMAHLGIGTLFVN